MTSYRIELANKVRNGRAVGNEYVAVALPSRTIVARFDTPEAAHAWVAARS